MICTSQIGQHGGPASVAPTARAIFGLTVLATGAAGICVTTLAEPKPLIPVWAHFRSVTRSQLTRHMSW